MSKTHSVRAPLQAVIVEWLVSPGDQVRAGDLLVVLEAMKMEHEVCADAPGQVLERFYSVGDAVEHLAELLSFSVQDGA